MKGKAFDIDLILEHGNIRETSIFFIFPRCSLPQQRQKSSFEIRLICPQANALSFDKEFNVCNSIIPPYSLPNDKISDWSKLKAFADDKIDVTEKWKFVFGKGRKLYGKRKKCL